MRTIIALLLFAGAALAQQGPEEGISQCVESCCRTYGGDWNGGEQACDMDSSDPDYQSLSDCELQCVYGGTGVDTGAAACCCAPGAALLGIFGAALKLGR